MALPTKPSALSPPYDNVDWVSGGTPGTDLIKPTAEITPGWALNQVVPFTAFNWLLRAFSLWSRYFEAWTDQVMDQSDDTKGTAVIGNAPYAGLNHLPMSAGTLRDQLITFCGTLYAHFAGTADKHATTAITYDGTGTHFTSGATTADEAVKDLDLELYQHEGVTTANYSLTVSPLQAVTDSGATFGPGAIVNTATITGNWFRYHVPLPVGAVVTAWTLYASANAGGSTAQMYYTAAANGAGATPTAVGSGVSLTHTGSLAANTESGLSATVASGQDWFVQGGLQGGIAGCLVVYYTAKLHSK